MYKLDKDTNVKAKVNSDGKLSAAYKQKISPLTTMTLSAVVDTVNLDQNNHKFGLVLNVTP
jgi:voltage-dependent anion channel protein 2